MKERTNDSIVEPIEDDHALEDLLGGGLQERK